MAWRAVGGVGRHGGEAAYWRDREICMAYHVWRIMEIEGIARAERLISRLKSNLQAQGPTTNMRITL